MSSELSQMILANGFDLKQNIKDQRNANSNEQLAQVLKQSQINERDAQTDYYKKQARGKNLENTQLAIDMSRGPQNTFKQVQGNDNNLYQVELNSQGNVVKSTLMQGMGNAPKKPLTALQEKLSLATGIDFRDMTQEQKTEAYKLVTDPKAQTELEKSQLATSVLRQQQIQQQMTKEQTDADLAELERLKAISDGNLIKSDAIGIIDTLLAKDNRDSLNNAIGPMDSSLVPNWAKFGKTRDFENDFEALKDMLTKENLGLLTGVMSDSDIRFIKNIATGRLRLDGSEGQAIKILKEMKVRLSNELGLDKDKGVIDAANKIIGS